MANLETSYLGLKLKNPVIVGSSGMSSSLENLKEIEKNGAGAVIIKSIFEEQINSETSEMMLSGKGKMKGWEDVFNGIISEKDYHYQEAFQYIHDHAKQNTLSDYLNFLEIAKKTLQIPVIASINCVSKYEWTYFAKKIQETGVDAIELNIYILPSYFGEEEQKAEKIYIDIINEVKKFVSIPVSVKIGFYFSSLASSLKKISESGISGIVLFNRPFNTDINIDKLEFDTHRVLSSPEEYSHTLRWTGILSGRIACEISSSTGVHNYSSVVKMLLAGAQTVQIASVLYQKGISVINEIVKGLDSWMDAHQFGQISDFRGKMALKNIENPASYERVQFMKHYSKIE